jgi:hypothetical protein
MMPGRLTVPESLGERKKLGSLLLVLGASAVGMIRLGGLVHSTAVNLLFEDQWDLLRPLFDGAGPWVRFDWQHGPHRQGLGGVLIGWLYSVSGWDVRAEAWAGLGILGIAAVLAVGLATRARGRLAWSDAAFPLLILAPVHWETLLLTPNLAHSVLPLLLVVLLGHALWMRNDSWRRVAAVGATFVACLFTGFALCAAAIALLIAALEINTRGTGTRIPSERTRSVLTLGAMLLGVLLFGYNYRWEPAVPGWTFPVTPWTGYLKFMALMYTSVLGWREITIVSTAAGACVLLAVSAVFALSFISVCRGRSDGRTQVVALLTGTSLCYGALTAFGRLPVNIEAAFMWRYTTLMLPGLCGLILATQRATSSSGHRLQLVVGFLGIALALKIWCNFEPERQALTTAEAKRRWISAYLRTHDLAAANRESNFFVYLPDPESPEIKRRLDFLEEHRLGFFRQPEPK